MSPLDGFLSFCGRESRLLLETHLQGALDGPAESEALAHLRKKVSEDIGVLEEVCELADHSPIDPCLRREIAGQARRHMGRLQELLAVLMEDDGAAAGAEASRIRQIQEDLQAGEWALQWPHNVGQAGFSGQSLLDPAVVGHSTPPQAPGDDDEEP